MIHVPRPPARVSSPSPFISRRQLIHKNLTTSEHRALSRVDYLLAPNHSGEYYNPFDQGCAANLIARMIGSHDDPPPGLLARLRAGAGSPFDIENSMA